jgi:hypothetical protein
MTPQPLGPLGPPDKSVTLQVTDTPGDYLRISNHGGVIRATWRDGTLAFMVNVAYTRAGDYPTTPA